jgi:hypothetical protein
MPFSKSHLLANLMLGMLIAGSFSYLHAQAGSPSGTCSTYETSMLSCSSSCGGSVISTASTPTGGGNLETVNYAFVCQEATGVICSQQTVLVTEENPSCCGAPGAACGGSGNPCCPGLLCTADNTCQPQTSCVQDGGSCSDDDQCCDAPCEGRVCGGISGCNQCDPSSVCYNFCGCYPNDPSCGSGVGCDVCDPDSDCYDYCSCNPDDPSCGGGACIEPGVCCDACDPVCGLMNGGPQFWDPKAMNAKPTRAASSRTSGGLKYDLFGHVLQYDFTAEIPVRSSLVRPPAGGIDN